MPTAKRQKFLDKQKKKLENQKTSEERKREVEKVKNKFQELGLSTEIEGVKHFYDMMDTFVETADGKQGTIPLPGLGREICYLLTNNKKHEVGAMLKYNSNLL
jgi:methionine synthase II (cobalamin-independent)